MSNSEVYNLKKLKWVIWGMVIPIFSNVVSNFFGDVIVVKIISFVIELIGFIILILGLKQISMYSYRFKKAYDYTVISMVIIIAILIGLFISVISSFLLTLMVVASVIAVFAILGLEIGFYYSLLKGIEEISMQAGEEKFAKKIENFWYFFIWTGIITVFSSFILLIVFTELKMILTIIASMALIIVNVMLFMYIFKAYKLLNGREIPKCVPSDEVMIKGSATSEDVTPED